MARTIATPLLVLLLLVRWLTECYISPWHDRKRNRRGHAFVRVDFGQAWAQIRNGASNSEIYCEFVWFSRKDVCSCYRFHLLRPICRIHWFKRQCQRYAGNVVHLPVFYLSRLPGHLPMWSLLGSCSESGSAQSIHAVLSLPRNRQNKRVSQKMHNIGGWYSLRVSRVWLASLKSTGLRSC